MDYGNRGQKRTRFCTLCRFSPSGEEAEAHLKLARDFGRMLAEANLHCVNGGTGGMMRELSMGARSVSGLVNCITLADHPPDHEAYTSHHPHPGLSPRQHALITSVTSHVALPGGIGTALEVLDVMCRKSLGEISRDMPLVCVRERDFRALRALVMDVVDRGFSYKSPLDMLQFVEKPEAAIDILLRHYGSA